MRSQRPDRGEQHGNAAGGVAQGGLAHPSAYPDASEEREGVEIEHELVRKRQQRTRLRREQVPRRHAGA